MTAALLLELLAKGVPIAIQIVEDARKGKLPTEADWMELERLGEYSSKKAMENRYL